MNEAAQNNLQMRLFFMRTLYQIKVNALRAHALCDGLSFAHLKYIIHIYRAPHPCNSLHERIQDGG